MVAAAAMAGVGAAVAGWYAGGRQGTREDAVAAAYRELAGLTDVLIALGAVQGRRWVSS